MKKGTVLTVDSKTTADMINDFLEKYPGLRAYNIYQHAGVSGATYFKIMEGKQATKKVLDKIVKAINDLDSLGSIEEIRQELMAKGNLQMKEKKIKQSQQNRNPDDNRKLQMELGGICIQYGLSKRDLMQMDSIRKYGKQEIVDYIIEHHMTLKSCKKVYEQSKAFDAVNWRKSM